MSTELESLIRPFQTNDISPSRTYFTPGEIGTTNIILRIGRNGSGKMMTGNYSYTQTFYAEQFQVVVKQDGSEE
jgi:hypothetical protein